MWRKMQLLELIRMVKGQKRNDATTQLRKQRNAAKCFRHFIILMRNAEILNIL